MTTSAEGDSHFTEVTPDIGEFKLELEQKHETLLARLDRQVPTPVKIAVVAVAAAGTFVYMVRTGFQA